MFHSAQYTSERFVRELKSNGIIQSMKSEWIGEQDHAGHEQAQRDITDYIADFYNYRRIHSAASNLPPASYERSTY